MNFIPLPPVISELLDARNKVREHYRQVLSSAGSYDKLDFTLDGNLVGDIGEAIAVELFGLQLDDRRSAEGIDGFAKDGRTVQVKATGTGRGPAFRATKTRADHLLFFDLDFESCQMSVVFNGPEHLALSYLPTAFQGQRSLTRNQIREADLRVKEHERLKLLR